MSTRSVARFNRYGESWYSFSVAHRRGDGFEEVQHKVWERVLLVSELAILCVLLVFKHGTQCGSAIRLLVVT